MKHHTTHVMVSVNHCPSSTTRIVPDGNCFFQTLSFTLTSSQEHHHEVRLLVTTYMIDNSANPQLSCFINDGETVDTYKEQSRCSYWVHGLLKLKSLLQSYYFKPQSMSMDLVERLTNGKNMQFIHACETEVDIITMNVYISNYFETVKRM